MLLITNIASSTHSLTPPMLTTHDKPIDEQMTHLGDMPVSEELCGSECRSHVVRRCHQHDRYTVVAVSYAIYTSKSDLHKSHNVAMVESQVLMSECYAIQHRDAFAC